MKDLKILNKEVKMMTSREICEVTGKQHKDTLRLIRSLINKGLIHSAQFAPSEYKDSTGRSLPMYELDKTSSILVVAQQSPEFTAALIARWDELENQKMQLPQTYVEALEALTVEVKKNIALENQAKIDAPKAETYDNISNADDLTSWNVTAKVLGMGRNNMLKELREKKVLMDAAWKGAEKHNVPYQKYIDGGYFQVKVKSYTEPETGTIYRSYTTFVTGKGLVWLEGLFVDQS